MIVKIPPALCGFTFVRCVPLPSVPLGCAAKPSVHDSHDPARYGPRLCRSLLLRRDVLTYPLHLAFLYPEISATLDLISSGRVISDR